jgi:hypothetical protein
MQNNQINQNNQEIPENFSISIREKTNDPLVDKISSIEVTLYKKNLKDENTINIQDIISRKESRTCVKLFPIPPNFTIFDICKLLDSFIKKKKKNL